MTPALPATPFSTDKAEFYALLLSQVESVIDPTLPQTANLANLSSLLYFSLTDSPVSRKINWCGFYLTEDPAAAKPRLVLGPFQGRLACTVIPFGRGVCGTAASTKETQVVKDVHSFKGHIACDSASESEIVVPIVVGGDVRGVLDIDCLVKGGFDEEDRKGLEAVVGKIVALF
ncbi:hypothetical protein HDU98_005702 [Podochytrium sp. JEL0797]|nr:hypothetical protein HDU98_005702 [Podochytrium sp. JEL0797]